MDGAPQEGAIRNPLIGSVLTINTLAMSRVSSVLSVLIIYIKHIVQNVAPFPRKKICDILKNDILSE